jgi:hypothetical protein
MGSYMKTVVLELKIPADIKEKVSVKIKNAMKRL